MIALTRVAGPDLAAVARQIRLRHGPGVEMRAARGADEIVRLRHDDAMRWLREVHAGKVRPVGMVGTATDTDPSPRRRSHLVVQTDRGWGR